MATFKARKTEIYNLAVRSEKAGISLLTDCRISHAKSQLQEGRTNWNNLLTDL